MSNNIELSNAWPFVGLIVIGMALTLCSVVGMWGKKVFGWWSAWAGLLAWGLSNSVSADPVSLVIPHFFSLGMLLVVIGIVSAALCAPAVVTDIFETDEISWWPLKYLGVILVVSGFVMLLLSSWVIVGILMVLASGVVLALGRDYWFIQSLFQPWRQLLLSARD